VPPKFWILDRTIRYLIVVVVGVAQDTDGVLKEVGQGILIRVFERTVFGRVGRQVGRLPVGVTHRREGSQLGRRVLGFYCGGAGDRPAAGLSTFGSAGAGGSICSSRALAASAAGKPEKALTMS